MSELAPGSRYGSFQIVAKLGRGLTGSVYHAVYQKDGSHVALKFLESRDESVASYFRNEMGLLRRAREHGRNHAHLVEYVASITTHEPHCLATRFYAEGRELTDEIAAGVTPGFALRVIEQVAGALDYLHYGHPDAPVVHRDVKPANILADPAGNTLLIDLSVACHQNFRLEHERSLGTPPYMAPEQYDGDEQPQTDQFALAMLTYQMLVGKTLLGSNPDVESKQMRALRDSGYARAREGLRHMPNTAEVVVRGIAYDWQLRYQTCEEFAYELRRAMVSDGVSLEVGAPATGPRRALSPGYIGMAAALLLALGLLGAALLGGGAPADPPADPPTATPMAPGTRPNIAITPPANGGVSVEPTSGLLPSQSTPTAGSGGAAQVRPAAAGCALRDIPSTDGVVIRYSAGSSNIPPDVALRMLEQRSDWYNVQLPDGRTGWCPAYQIGATR